MKNPIFRRPPMLFATGVIVGAAALATLQFASTFVGDSTSRNDTKELKQQNSAAGSNSQAISTRDVELEIDSRNEIRSLADLERFSSPFEQSLALHEFLSRAGVPTLVDLIDQSLEIELDSRRRLTQQTIFRRLASTEPEQALAQVEKVKRFDRDSILSTIFGEWALLDLDEAVAKAKSQSGTKKTAALKGLLQSRDDLSEDVRREIARNVGNEQLAVDLIAHARVEEAIENPELAWQTLLSDDSSDMDQVSLFMRVAESWLAKDGLSALKGISDSLTHWKQRSLVLVPILNQLVSSDPLAAFNFALSNSNSDESLLTSSLVTRWASLDPEAAYNAVSAVEPMSLRTSLQKSVVYRWASDRPREVLRTLDRFSTPSRERARNAAIVSIASEAPEEAAELFAEFHDETNSFEIADSIASAWSQENPVRALEWVLSNPQLGEAQYRMLSVVLGATAQDNPQLALETALDQPLGKRRLGLELDVIKSVSQYDLPQARSMLNQVREGRTRSEAFSYIGAKLIRKGDSDQAMRLADDLSEPSKSQYVRDILGMWASSSPLELYETLPELGNAKFQSYAAYRIINRNRWQPVLSEDQIDAAHRFLSEQHQTALRRSQSSPGTVRYSIGWTPEGITIGPE